MKKTVLSKGFASIFLLLLSTHSWAEPASCGPTRQKLEQAKSDLEFSDRKITDAGTVIYLANLQITALQKEVDSAKASANEAVMARDATKVAHTRKVADAKNQCAAITAGLKDFKKDVDKLGAYVKTPAGQKDDNAKGRLDNLSSTLKGVEKNKEQDCNYVNTVQDDAKKWISEAEYQVKQNNAALKAKSDQLSAVKGKIKSTQDSVDKEGKNRQKLQNTVDTLVKSLSSQKCS